MKLDTFAAVFVASVGLMSPAAAHHSFAMFDASKTVTLNGTVKELEWTNPHCWLYLMVADESGKAVEYSFEMQGTGQSVKFGWTPESVAPGDKLSIEMHPLKTGAHGGQLISVTLASGRKLTATAGIPPSPYGD